VVGKDIRNTLTKNTKVINGHVDVNFCSFALFKKEPKTFLRTALFKKEPKTFLQKNIFCALFF